MTDPQREEIGQALLEFIENQENIGDTSGGSGHLSHISVEINPQFTLTSIDEKTAQFGVTFDFTKTIETEFTYYPDNPPQIYKYSQTCYLDNRYTIIGFEKPVLISSNYDLDILEDQISGDDL